MANAVAETIYDGVMAVGITTQDVRGLLEQMGAAAYAVARETITDIRLGEEVADRVYTSVVEV